VIMRANLGMEPSEPERDPDASDAQRKTAPRRARGRDARKVQLFLRRLATNPTAPRPAISKAYVSGSGMATTFRPTTMSS